jgi:hypothetical protein
MISMQNEENDLGRAFNDLMKFTFRKYRNVSLEREGGGYKVHGIWYPTWQKACEAIDKELRDIRERK